MRPHRRKLKFDEESVNGLLQEIYEESHNIKAKIASFDSSGNFIAAGNVSGGQTP